MKKASTIKQPILNSLDMKEEEICKYEVLGCDTICQGLAMISGKWKLKYPPSHS